MNKIRKQIRSLLTFIMYWVYRKIYRIDIDRTSWVSINAKFDKINPRGIHVGKHTYITSGVFILAHDRSRSLYNVHTYIGNNCFIGVNSIVLPGVKIGDHVVVGAGSIVTKDLPSHCVAVGNPASIIKRGISLDNSGHICPPPPIWIIITIRYKEADCVKRSR